MAKPREALTFPVHHAAQLTPYLPPSPSSTSTSPPSPSQPHKPFVTLTYATSLDSSLSLSPGTQTVLSGPLSKAMTHHLRSVHGAILIGCGTAIADDPSLNCRIEGVGGYGGEGLEGQPRPVVVDPWGRWEVSEESKVVKLAREGRGRGPWVVGSRGGPWFFGFRFPGDGWDEVTRKRRVLESVGGRYLTIEAKEDGRMDWNAILRVLAHQGIQSVMIEGGGSVINELLSPRYIGLVDSVVVTIAPTWLGKGGVLVCPDERRDEDGGKIAVGRLKDPKWVPLGEDVVLCGRI